MLTRRGALGAASLALALPPSNTSSYWPNVARFAADNTRIRAEGIRPRVVFMGDSITEIWAHDDPGFFSHGVVSRGIAGQTTAQMLLRFRADVLSLRPGKVHILGGINDLRGKEDRVLLEMTRDNVTSMVELARAHGIAPIIAAILPYAISGDPAKELTAGFNHWAKEFAQGSKVGFIDYRPALTDRAGALVPNTCGTGSIPVQRATRACAC